jgi:hypothetical protein
MANVVARSGMKDQKKALFGVGDEGATETR